MCCEIEPVWSERSVKTHHGLACDQWSWTARRSLRGGNVTTGIYLILHFRSPYVRSTTRHENVASLTPLSDSSCAILFTKDCSRPREKFQELSCKIHWRVTLVLFSFVRSHWQPVRAEEISLEMLVLLRQYIFFVLSAFVLWSPGFSADGVHNTEFRGDGLSRGWFFNTEALDLKFILRIMGPK